ncbi:restriction endonuclease subunit S [Morganella morganii subsp. morganii]|uniref:restriction endonuclease subunit S n=1 Tax=Morganella morganii TaxID=582 RepID=UPI001BDAF66E|nr:restriction endonuclease subunit S [Morganella morganii]MBT0502405.1 restriction endonuclease subunit S [Morganella morganii subsp. morganii]QWM14717.1 restriction endonuclease subunit S [Morganella morganii subsp. morganii]
MSELSYLEKLLDGVEVEWLSIKGVAEVRSGWGFPKIYQGKSEGIYPFYKVSDMNTIGNETVMSIANNFIDNGAVKNLGVTIAPEGTVIFPKIGAAIATNKKRLLSVPSAYDNNIMGLVVTEKIISRYMFYWIQTINLSMLANDSGAVPSIRKSDVEELPIPIPCPGNPEKSLAIQSEIVRILDAFTALTAELTAELTARKKQYNYYRDQLLSFDDGEVEWKTLGDILNMRAGQHISASKIMPAQDNEYIYPCFGGNGIRGFVKDKSHEGAYLLIGRQGALCGNVQRMKGKFYATEHAVVAIPRHEHKIDIDWAFHMLTFMNLNQYASQSAQPGLAVGKIQTLKIPLPSIRTQKNIAKILDKFDTLTNSITEGLPREIELRQKQYEYYRDLLFSFPKPESVNN